MSFDDLFRKDRRVAQLRTRICDLDRRMTTFGKAGFATYRPADPDLEVALVMHSILFQSIFFLTEEGTMSNVSLSKKQREELLRTLKARFEKNMNRMLLGMIKGRANTSFLIVQRKAPEAAPVFVTTVKDSSRGRNLNRRIPPWIWPRPWELSF